MKNLINSRSQIRKSFYIFGLLVATLYFSSFGNSNFKISENLTNYFAPDSIPPDSALIADTISVVEIYEIGDSAKIVTSGLDTILLLHTDTAANFISEGSSEVYYIGEEDTLLNYFTLVDSTAYYITNDTIFIQNTMYVDSSVIALDSTIILDTAISSYFIKTDTIYFKPDSTAYFIATDTSIYYIPKEEIKAYKLIKVDSSSEATYVSSEKIIIDPNIVLNHSVIKVYLGGAPKEINQGIFGFTLEGNFLPDHLPESDVIDVPGDGITPANPEAWQWLSDLKPRCLRFPGGASGMFMHLRPYRDTNGDGTPDPIHGYGYDIEEIIRFYDMTENYDSDPSLAVDPATVMNTNPNNNVQAKALLGATSMGAIIGDLTDDNECDDCWMWMNSLEYQKNLEDVYKKWKMQDDVPGPGSESAYIEQFIHLVQQIQYDNDYQVDVLLDLNILSLSASQCKALVLYLRGNGVNVVGVELGNECYFKWGADLMGFSDATGNHDVNAYWSYINGEESSPIFWDKFFDNPDLITDGYYILPEAVTDNHDYIGIFKTDPAFSDNPVKIGIPVPNADPPTGAESWNTDLALHNSDIIPGTDIKKYDAFVVHNYYDAAHYKWNLIPQIDMCLKYPVFAGTCNLKTCGGIAEIGNPNLWRYDIYDERLRTAFDGFLGVKYNLTGNIGDYIRTVYFDEYSALNIQLQYDPIHGKGKEIWNTEKNIKSEVYGVMPEEEKLLIENLIHIYDNSFPHGLITQEWFLNDLKHSSLSKGWQNGITYGNYHNYAGGAWSDMLVQADCADKANHLPPIPTPINGNQYYAQRTTYWVYKLLSEISKNDLKYLPSNMEMSDFNPNLAPTVFVHQNDYLDFYFSNMKGVPQKYIIFPHNITSLLGGVVPFDKFLGMGIHDVEVDFNYMSSGRNTIFFDNNDKSVNNCYGCLSATSPGNYHRFDIQGIDDGILDMVLSLDYPGAYEVTVPANSVGYFQLQIVWWEPLRESVVKEHENSINIYPNPTEGTFKVQSNISGLLTGIPLNIEVLSITGISLMKTVVQENQDINISGYPAGIYLISIKCDDGINITKQLIKME